MRHKWAIPGEQDVKLPWTLEGLARLKSTIQQSPPGVGEHLREAVWRGLLAEPGMIVALQQPSPVELLQAGLTEQYSGRTLRHIGLANVFSETKTEISSDGYLVGDRLAVVANAITVEGIHKGASPLDVSVVAHWVDDTFSFSALLEALWGRAASSARSAIPHGAERRRITILPCDAPHPDLGPDAQDQWHAICNILDFQPQIVDNLTGRRSEVEFRLRSEPPSALVVWTSRVRNYQTFISAFKSGASGGIAIEVEADSVEQFSRELRRQLLRVRKINPGLLLTPDPENDENPSTEKDSEDLEDPPLPIGSWTKRKKHDRFGYFYEFDDGPLWYSKVVAQQDRHGGCYFKLHRKIAETLEWEANLGRDGKSLPTHKGPVGLSIPMSELHGE